MSGRRPTDEPSWPTHHTDAPPPEDPRSLRRGLVAGFALLLIAAALAVVAPSSGQARTLIVLLGWIVAVGFGGWAYRGGSNLVAPATRLALVFGIVTVVGASVLVFVSLQVREILAGTVIVGGGGSGCDLLDQAEAFELGEPVYAVAHMQRVIEAGEEVTMTVTWEGQVETTLAEVSPTDFDCLGSPLKPPEAGSYAVVVTAHDEVLAAGSFEVLPQVQ